MKKLFLLFATATTLLASCTKEKDKSGTFKGPDVQVHGGKTWSSVTLDKEGVPTRLALVLNDAAINSVPVGPDGHGHDHANSFAVPLHPKAVENTPFKFIMLDWNPEGHPPQDVYTLPHFDIHFYQNTPAEVASFTDAAKLAAAPAADYLPANHIAPAPPVPMMGQHWIDVTSGEFNGQGFTQTFLYGSYDSKVVFYEPMLTLNWLKNTPSFDRPIPQPAKFGVNGYFPTRMKVNKHNGVTEIILDGFVKRQAS